MSQSVTTSSLNYRTIRGIHISIVFTFTITIQELWNFPHAGWCGFALMMIYAGFDSGTTLFRAYHRFWGMILGLFSGYLLWLIGHFDYRILIILIPLTVFFAYFLVGRAYSIPTIFTVNTAVIGTGFFAAHSQFSITNFIVDYTFCTVIAFLICIVFEYFVFRHYGLMRRFIHDTQNEVITNFRHLIVLLNQDKIARTDWFNACIALNRSLTTVNNLVDNSAFEYSSQKVVGEEFERFVELSNQVFIDIKALYIAHHTIRYQKYDYQLLYREVITNLKALGVLLPDQESLIINLSEIENKPKR